MVSVDSEAVFNAGAAVISAVAVLIFLFNVDFGYSPVSKAALVAAFLVGVFALTQRRDDYQVAVLGYGVVVTAGVGVFVYLVGTFDGGSALTVAGLLVAAGVLYALGTRLDEDGHLVSGRTATYAFGAAALLAGLLLLADVATGGLAYELQPETEVEFGDRTHEEVRLGGVVVTNPTPFPQEVDAPDYEACAAGNWTAYRAEGPEGDRPVEVRAHVDDGYEEHVFGYATETYPVVAHVTAQNLSGETVPLEVTDSCPAEETGSPSVALFPASDADPVGRPA